MSCDVLELAEFYASPKGPAVSEALARPVAQMWPDLKGQRVMGLGFAQPLMNELCALGQPRTITAMMPERMGVMHWVNPCPSPRKGNAASLVQPGHLPLRDAMMDKVIILHGLEHSAHHTGFLREVWRVLAPGGTIILVVPNRRSLWAQLEGTPFGHGTPYTRAQLANRLRAAMFTPLDWRMALAVPPIKGVFGAAWARPIDAMGIKLWPRFAGVHVVLAQKQMASMMPSGGNRGRVPLLVPATNGVPAGATPNWPKKQG